MKIFNTCCLGYLALVVLSWVLMFLAGDLWWPATLFLFAPRWILALPAAVLIPLAAFTNRSLLLPLIAALLIIFGPIMGFTFSVNENQSPDIKSLRVVSCNLQNGNFDLVAMDAFIRNVKPEIVALQELPAAKKIRSLDGWHHIVEGDLHIFSRYPLVKVDFRKANVPLHKWPRFCFLACTVKAPSGDLTFCTVHLPSPRYGLQSILDKSTIISLKRKKLLIDETEYRRQKSQEVSAIVAALPSPKIIAGDFNMPVESSIYRTYWSAYQNAFSDSGSGYGWTQRATLRGVPIRIRIDHVLLDKNLNSLICETGPDLGSDHLAMFVAISFP